VAGAAVTVWDECRGGRGARSAAGISAEYCERVGRRCCVEGACTLGRGAGRELRGQFLLFAVERVWTLRFRGRRPGVGAGAHADVLVTAFVGLFGEGRWCKSKSSS